MNFNYKLFFKYILFNSNQIFLKYLFRNDKNLIIYITENNLYYLTLHLKLSSLFYSTQLVDMFSYELPTSASTLETKTRENSVALLNNNLMVYNFHSILSQQRFFLFVTTNAKKNINKISTTNCTLNSITELFLNANWLEREISELHGIFFSSKKDLRNLMLPYGDTTAPMKKSFPSIGTREIFYDSVSDLLIQTPVTIQF